MKTFSKGFVSLWMIFVCISPWFLVAMALSFFSPFLGSGIFNFLFGFVGISGFIYLIYVVFINKKEYKLSPEKSFLLNHKEKVFWSGVISCYVFGFIISLFNPIIGILIILGNTPLLIGLGIIFYIGKKKIINFLR